MTRAYDLGTNRGILTVDAENPMAAYQAGIDQGYRVFDVRIAGSPAMALDPEDARIIASLQAGRFLSREQFREGR